MALFRGVIRSNVLGMDTGLCVILPQDRLLPETAPGKVLYLLHGLGDNCEAWVRYTAIERYARQYALTVVMPEVQRSFYMNMAYGLPYFTYITEELPALCRDMFGISGQKEDSYVAGLSMGGYGAMLCALTCPEKYAGGASFSGAVDFRGVLRDHMNGDNIKQMQAGIGMDLEVREADDLFLLADRISLLPDSDRPKLYLSCGFDDFLYESNIDYKNHLESKRVSHLFMDWRGDHDWDFWDKSVQHALVYFFAPTKDA
ncbi:MAG: esterase family protein [Oscillospiraceae bacterium]|jgi:S-formylglutathione hydrolase FrmB|nr:esterase family protein [Oscillospiraceae bacterium]